MKGAFASDMTINILDPALDYDLPNLASADDSEVRLKSPSQDNSKKYVPSVKKSVG